MNSVRRMQINTISDSVRDSLDLSIPINLDLAVERLGGQIRKETLDAGIDGMIKKSNDSFLIKIPPEQTQNRVRFSIAHELGHLFLHMGYLLDEQLWNSTDEYTDSVYFRVGHSEEEYEAHEFAASFLMPKNTYLELVNKIAINNIVDINTIADYFQVSKDAAWNRGRWLKVFAWQ